MNTAEKYFLLAFIVRASLIAHAPDDDLVRQSILLILWGVLFLISGYKRDKEETKT